MNCKPGDLAIIVRSIDEANVGLIVEILRPAIPGVDFHESYAHMPAWWVRGRTPMSTPVIPGYAPLPARNERPFADHCLRPISGVPVMDDVSDEVTA